MKVISVCQTPSKIIALNVAETWFTRGLLLCTGSALSLTESLKIRRTHIASTQTELSFTCLHAESEPCMV
jgi:hypothetical protein